MGIPYTDSEAAIVKAGIAAGKLCREIAVDLNRAGFSRSLDSVMGYAGRRKLELPKQIATIKTHAWRQVGTPFRVEQDGARKVLFISDTHIPWQKDDVLEHALDNHGDADLLVLGGDVLDMYETSKWPKSQDLATVDEIASAREWIERIANQIGRVVVIGGNHEARLQHYLASRLSPGVIAALPSSAVELCAGGITGVVTATTELPWIATVGRVAFAHPSHASTVPLRTSLAVQEWLQRRGDNPQAIVIGHTHQQGSVWRSGALMIESGCACLPMSYDGHPKLLYRNPQVCGYAVVWIDKNGNLDANRTKTVYLGAYTLEAPRKFEF